MLVEGLKEGKIHGLTLQNPVRMGYLGVKTAAAAIQNHFFLKRLFHHRRISLFPFLTVTTLFPFNLSQRRRSKRTGGKSRYWRGSTEQEKNRYMSKTSST